MSIVTYLISIECMFYLPQTSPNVDTQLYNAFYNITQELVELPIFTFKYNFIKQIIQSNGVHESI